MATMEEMNAAARRVSSLWRRQDGDQVADTEGDARGSVFWLGPDGLTDLSVTPSRMAEADNKDVQDRVDRVLDDLAAGRVLKPQVEKLGRAVDVAKRDQSVHGAIGKGWR